MKYPNLAAALREMGTPSEIQQKLGVSRRMTFHYLAGNGVPPSTKIVLYPELIQALQRDLKTAPQLQAA
jgi:hypothetical protein